MAPGPLLPPTFSVPAAQFRQPWTSRLRGDAMAGVQGRGSFQTERRWRGRRSRAGLKGEVGELGLGSSLTCSCPSSCLSGKRHCLRAGVLGPGRGDHPAQPTWHSHAYPGHSASVASVGVPGMLSPRPRPTGSAVGWTGHHARARQSAWWQLPCVLGWAGL